jgi:hypothetical protein
MPIITGTVYDDAASPVGGRVVRAYNRENGSLLASSVSSTGSIPMTDDSFARFKLDSISTIYTYSEVGGYRGTLFNTPSVVTGINGSGALSFNGTNQYLELEVSNNVTYNAANGGFAICFWLYRVQDNEASSVLLKANDSVQNPLGNRLNLHFPWTDGKWYWDFGNITYGRVIGNWNSAWYNNWIFVVAQYTSSNMMQLYVNGVKQGETSVAANPQSITLSNNILMGRYEPSVYVNMRLDQIRLFGRGLSEVEIGVLYSESGSTFDAPVGQYSLNVGSYTGEANVLFLDDTPGTVYNDIVHRTIVS